MPREVVLRLAPSLEPLEARDEQRMLELTARAVNRRPEELAGVRTRRISFDARRRERVWRVVVDAYLVGEALPEGPVTEPPQIARPDADAARVLVVGAGPAGMYCALDLVTAGFNVTLVDRGGDVRGRRVSLARLNKGERVDGDSNYCFGEGGAGTYSDGKLYTRSGKKSKIRGVLEVLVAHGASPEILTSWRPHVGSNRLPRVVVALRETLVAAGVDVRFGLRVEELLRGAAGEVCGAQARELASGKLERIEAQAVVLATGHSALDSLELAARAGAFLEPKGFALGVRAEHSQQLVDDQQYGGLREVADLPPAFYELKSQADERGVYSFCMCPGGFIVPATTGEGRVVVNGMSLSRRDSPFANSGVVVSLEPEDWCAERASRWGFDELLAKQGMAPPPARPEDDPLAGVRLQLALEQACAQAGGGAGRAPAQRVDAFVEGGDAPEVLPTSFRPGLRAVSLDSFLPRGVSARLRAALGNFETQLPGYLSERGQLVGVESRTSSPVRIARDAERLEAIGAPGLFPCGEGAGYAGGIVSAALDGRRVATVLSELLV